MYPCLLDWRVTYLLSATCEYEIRACLVLLSPHCTSMHVEDLRHVNLDL